MASERKRGVVNDWVEGEGLKTVCEWARYGLTDTQMAENIGVNKNTFSRWQKQNPEFAEAIKKARVQTNIEIENAMIDLACGNKFVEETKTILVPKTGEILRIERVKKQIPPSATMLIFLAKNRMRDKYKDYVPVPYEPENADVKQDVKIYLPDNGRDKK